MIPPPLVRGFSQVISRWKGVCLMRRSLLALAVTLILALVSLLALWIPARRASSVGPVSALSRE